MAESLMDTRASARGGPLWRGPCHSLQTWLHQLVSNVPCRYHAHAEAHCRGQKAPSCALDRPGLMVPDQPGSRLSHERDIRRSLVRARADAEAMEARAHQAESAEASLAAELRNAEAQSLSNEGLIAKCATLEERLSEMRAEQVRQSAASLGV